MNVEELYQAKAAFTVYSMTENTQFPGFVLMFPQVVQKHQLARGGTAQVTHPIPNVI